MAHWAELDNNNIVLRVTVGDNNDPNGDEGYQWLIDNLGGRWVKTSYNTIKGKHILGGTPFRGTFAFIGYSYDEAKDRFLPPSPHKGWVFDDSIYEWVPPTQQPDGGFWRWDDDTEGWVEIETDEF